jgi:ADP-heptose:LPS heptosyltransferase
MWITRVNRDYLKFYREVPLSWALSLTRTRRRPRQSTTDVLILNPCLIGEFATSVPALSDFIQRNLGIAIDLMVSPPLRALAERIRDVRHVFVARSLNERPGEMAVGRQDVGSYRLVLVLRISSDSYRMARCIPAQNVRTNAWPFLRYGVHLAHCMRRRKTPRRWAEINFEMLGGAARSIEWEEMFNFNVTDQRVLEALPVLSGSELKVLVHTAASWVMNRWPLDNWCELLRQLRPLRNIRFIFVGEGAEALADYAYVASRLPFRIESLIGETRIEELLLIMRQCDFFIGVDSGPANLAHLANLRSIKLLGPAPHMYTPPDARDIVIDKSNGREILERFIRKKNPIIETITPAEVREAFVALLRCGGAPGLPRDHDCGKPAGRTLRTAG